MVGCEEKEKERKKGVGCVVCNNTLMEQRSWKSFCPRYEGSICEGHCFDCEFLEKETSLFHCSLIKRDCVENKRFERCNGFFVGVYYFVSSRLDLISELVLGILCNDRRYKGKFKYILTKYHIKIWGYDEVLLMGFVDRVMELDITMK